MNFAHRAFGVFNILMAVFFSAQIVWSRLQEAADTGSFIFWALLAVGSLLAGIGYFLTARWIVAIGAIPVILLCLFIGLASVVGGWIWGPRETGTMNLLMVGGFALAVVELIGLGIAFVGRRRPPDASHEDDSTR